MKKILIMLLNCALVLSTINVFAETNSTTEKTYNKEIHLLTQLGIVEISEEEDFSRPVTRAEFVDYIAKFYGETGKGKRYFTDVDENYWAFNSIGNMTDKGLIARADDGLFYPERIISLNEACKIVMTAAGYEKYAEVSGGYTAGYYNLAKRQKIIPSINNANALSLGECFEIIYNGITIGICEEIHSKNENISFEISDEKSLLSLTYDMYIGKGRLTGMYGASMAGVRLVTEENMAYIDDEEYYVADGVLKEEYFADYVDFVYRDNSDDTKTLICVEPVKNKNDDIKIFSADISDFDDRSYTLTYYNDNDRLKTVDFVRGSQIIYNGREYTGSVQEVFDEFISKSNKGTVKIKDIDNDGNYDAVIIKSYRNIVVGYMDAKATQFYNAYDSQDYFDIENMDSVTIKNLAGNETVINASSVKVLSIAVSKDNNNAEIIICDEIVSGIMRQNNTGEGTITIDETVYDVDKLVFDRMNLPSL